MYQIKSSYPLRTFTNNENLFYFLIAKNYLSNINQYGSFNSFQTKAIYQKVDPTFLNPTYSLSHIGHIPWIASSSEAEEYLDEIDLMPSQHESMMLTSLTISDEESYVVNKLKRFEEIKEVYINHNKKDLTLIKIKIEMENYNYDLMRKIFEEAEFPVKDNFPKQLFDFKYIPITNDNNDLININLDKQIYNKQADEITQSIKNDRGYYWNFAY